MIYRMGELAEIIDGDRGPNYPRQDELSNDGFCLFLNAGNVTKEGFSFENSQFISKEKDEMLRKGKLCRGDVVYTTRGTVGNAAFYSPSVPYDNIRINSGMIILRPYSDIVDARLLYQILRSACYRPYFHQYCTGSAQPQLPIKIFNAIELEIPSLNIQHKIADILSAYDNLIEVNQKQIELLEEAAQRLYKEWFVDLRFPGHENVPLVDGIPEGWKTSVLGEIAKFARGRTITKNEARKGSVPVVAGGLEPAYYHDTAITEAPVITVSGSGANAGYTRLYHEKIWASDCSYVDSSSTAYVYFTYCFLKESKSELDSLQKGAAQPHVYAKDINLLKIIKPVESVLSLFESVCVPIFGKIAICEQIIRNAVEARDRLLPKLMSGELEV